MFQRPANTSVPSGVNKTGFAGPLAPILRCKSGCSSFFPPPWLKAGLYREIRKEKISGKSIRHLPPHETIHQIALLFPESLFPRPLFESWDGAATRKRRPWHPEHNKLLVRGGLRKQTRYRAAIHFEGFYSA